MSFPWRQPASSRPAVITADDAVVAARVLEAGAVVPMHYGGYDLEPFYRSALGALPRFIAAAERGGVNAVARDLGRVLDLAPQAAVGDAPQGR